MPKTTISFKLPEEKSDLLLAQRGKDFYACLIAIEQEMRQHRKYGKKMEDCWEAIGLILMDANLEEIE